MGGFVRHFSIDTSPLRHKSDRIVMVHTLRVVLLFLLLTSCSCVVMEERGPLLQTVVTFSQQLVTPEVAEEINRFGHPVRSDDIICHMTSLFHVRQTHTVRVGGQSCLKHTSPRVPTKGSNDSVLTRHCKKDRKG